MPEDDRKKHSLTFLIVIFVILASFSLWQRNHFDKLDLRIDQEVEKSNHQIQSAMKLYNQTFLKNKDLEEKVKVSEETIKKLKFEISNLKEQK
tara:strand:- start:689 stop:967 length:279 start_codon:yes stop_codon:yes gene_type:complete